MSKIFNNLLESKIETFVNEFKNLSKSLFLNENGNLIHPGEFGVYRERIVSELLSMVTPGRLDTGSGFIITVDDKVSTQCDIVIFDRNSTPKLESKNNQKFFPVETVAGVIEVKSNMSKSELIDSLKKLAEIKKLRNSIPITNPEIFKDNKKNINVFDPIVNIKDQMGTFIICNKFDFDIVKEFKKDKNFLDEVYSDDNDKYKHNMVLSIEDGLLLYHDGKKMIFYPYWKLGEFNKNVFMNPINNITQIPHVQISKYEHIILFLNYYNILISSVSIMYIEITNYLGSRRAKQVIYESKTEI
ncbi:MAG: hypothetical protein PHU32_05915 [Candidatus ainarchaeum sp.]|nr:hypothetical protein [Candidatus ainarchaeum sp.]